MATTKYAHSKEQSAEFLRQVLPLMSKQSAALHPISYAVWYEYVAGINPEIRKAIDGVSANGKTLDDNAVYALYAQHVAEADETEIQRISASVQEVLADISLYQRGRGAGETIRIGATAVGRPGVDANRRRNKISARFSGYFAKHWSHERVGRRIEESSR